MAVVRIDEPLAGVPHGTDKPLTRILAIGKMALLESQNLVDTAAPNLGGGQDDPPHSAIDRHRIPRFAHAGTVNFPRCQRVGAEWRRHRHDFDILVRPNATARKPVSKHVVMRGMAVDHPETQPSTGRCPRSRFLCQRCSHRYGIGQDGLWPDGIGKVRSQGNGIAVQTQYEGCGKGLRRAPPAKGGRNRQRGEEMRRIGMAVKQAVENGRPGHIAGQVQVEPLRLSKAELSRQNGEARIHQWQESDCQSFAHRIPLISSCAVTTASAMAAMRRLESIALRRNSA